MALIDGLEYYRVLIETRRMSRWTPMTRLLRREGLPSTRHNLLKLLVEFDKQQCENPRDRIFSLLSLCSGEGKDVQVDYRLSTIDLAASVLSTCARSLCICSALLVLRSLNIVKESPTSTTVGNNGQPSLEFEVRLSHETDAGTNWFLHTNDNNPPWTPSFGPGRYLNMYGTCKLQTLIGKLVSWNETAQADKGKVRWGFAMAGFGDSGTRGTVTYGDGFQTRQDSNEMDVYIVRIALWLLPEIFGEEIFYFKTDLCDYATRDRLREKGRLMRILPGTQSLG